MATVVTCPSCGTDAPTGAARWCGSCGTPLHGGKTATTARDPAAPLAVRLDEPLSDTAEEAVPTRHRNVAIGAVVAVVVALLTAQSNASGAGPTGFSARGDAARSGVVSPVELGAPTGVAWRAAIEGDGGWNSHHAVIADDHVAVANQSGLTLHDRASGALRWHRPDLHVRGPVALLDDVAVVFDLVEPSDGVVLPHRAEEEGRIVALELSDGTARWSQPTEFGAPHLVSHPEGLLVTDLGRRVSLLEPDSGEPRWTLDAFEVVTATVRDVLVPDEAGLVHLVVTRPAGIDPDEAPSELVSEHLVGLDAASGEVRFEVAADRETLASDPLALVGGTAVGVDAERLWVWDAADGRRLHVAEHGLANPIQGVVGAGSTAVVLDVTGSLAGFDTATATRRWSQRVSGAQLDGLTVVGDSLLVTGGSQTSILNLETGQLRGLFDVPAGAQRSSPDPGGRFVVTANGEVTVHDPDTSTVSRWVTPVDPWPEPVVRDGGVAVVTSGEVSLFEAATGDDRWRLRVSSDRLAISPRTVEAPALGEETLVFSPPYDAGRTPDEGLGGVDLIQSVLVWDRTGDSLPPTGPLTLAGETVFLPVGDEVHGHDLVTGRRDFASRAGHLRGAIATHPEYLFAATDPVAVAEDDAVQPSLLAIRRVDRTEAWEQPLATCAPPTVSDEFVLATGPEAISAHDVHRGVQQWRTPLERPGCLDLAVADGVVVAVEGRTALVGIDAGTGRVLWRHRVPTGVAAAPAIAGSTVLVPSLDGSLVGVDLEEGTERWRSELGATPASSVTVAGERYLVVTREGELLALDS